MISLRYMHRAVFFDVDDTLTRGVIAHKRAFSYAFKKVFNINATIDIINYHGMTDQQIILETLKKKGLRESVIKSTMKDCIEAMTKYYETAVENDNIVVLDGVEKLLHELKKRKVILGLVTGNSKKIAMKKLNKVGIGHYFVVGAFGDDDIDRSRLVELAIKRIERKFGIKPSKVFLFGDTPCDIEAGEKVGAITVGVATGKYTKKELLYAGADFVVDNLKDTEGILDIIFDSRNENRT